MRMFLTLLLTFIPLLSQAFTLKCDQAFLDKAQEEMDTPAIIKLSDEALRVSQLKGDEKTYSCACYFKARYYYLNFEFEKAVRWERMISEDHLWFLSKYNAVIAYSIHGDLEKARIISRLVCNESRDLFFPFGKDISALIIAESFFYAEHFEVSQDQIKALLQDHTSLDPTLAILTQQCLLKSPIKKTTNQYNNDFHALIKMVDHPTNTKDWAFLSQKHQLFEACYHASINYLKFGMKQIEIDITSLLSIINTLYKTDPSSTIKLKKNYLNSIYNAYSNKPNSLALYSELLNSRIPPSSPLKKETYFLSAKENEKMGNFKKAIRLYDRYNVLEDSIFFFSYKSEVKDFAVKLDLQRKKELSNQLLSDSQKQYTAIFILCIVILLLLILIGGIFHAQRKLKKAKNSAEQSRYLKSVFLANMNHELRSPLNSISGFSQLLVNEEDPKQAAYYSTIIQSSNHLLERLLSDVQDLSRIESNTLQFEYTSVSLSKLFVDVYEMYHINSTDKIELILETHPEASVWADKERVIQVIINFLSNAFKNTTKGTIRMGYQIQKNQVYCYVTDTGKGITEEEHEHLFDRFVQSEGYQQGGVGLGLALCKGFVIEMKGEIGLESTIGIGSTFWFTLPLLTKSDPF